MEVQTHCWICRQVADSAEYRVKKSDLVNLHSSGSYEGKNALVLIREDKEIPIRGPNSKVVKYKNNLCAKCNNEFSQPFDKAYEFFIKALHGFQGSNEEGTLTEMATEFCLVF